MEYVSQAVFLVGGKGTRLGHLTQSTPNPLLPLWDDFSFLDLLNDEAARPLGTAGCLKLAEQ